MLRRRLFGMRVPFLLIAVLGIWGVVLGLLLLWLARESRAANGVLQPDAVAPLAWTLPDHEGRTHAAQNYTKRPLALAFLPDLNSESHAELRSLQRAQIRFDTLGVKMFAIARATQNEARRAHNTLKLDFPILSDGDGGVARLYGAADSGNDSADGGGGRRVSYVVGANGKILLPVTQINPATHGDQLYGLTECCLDDTPQPPSKLIGRAVADFRLPRIDAETVTENLYGPADRSQTATVLFVLSARCPCSARYDTRFRDIARQYVRQGVRFVGLNSNADESAADIAAHARRANLPFPILRDADTAVAERLGAQVTPEVFVMDKAGVLRYHGRIDDSRDIADVRQHDLRNALDFLFAGKNPPRAEQSAFGCAIARGDSASISAGATAKSGT